MCNGGADGGLLLLLVDGLGNSGAFCGGYV
jgi:hypothetical protein